MKTSHSDRFFGSIFYNVVTVMSCVTHDMCTTCMLVMFVIKMSFDCCDNYFYYIIIFLQSGHSCTIRGIRNSYD